MKVTLKRKTRQVLWFYAFIGLSLIGFLLLQIYPFVRAFVLSFTDATLNSFEPEKFVGFNNYIKAFKDPFVWESLKLSAIYAVFNIVLINIISFCMALLLNTQNKKGISVFRTIFYIPSIIPTVASVIMFSWIFSPSQGIVNAVLRVLGVENPPLWMESTQTVLPTLIVISLWGFGGKMVIYLAGLQGVNRDYYEVASLEGASKFCVLFHITIPLVMPMIFYNVLMSIISAIQVFTEAYVLSGTGAGVPVNFYVVNIYSKLFSEFDLGYSSALAWILFVIILVISKIYNFINDKFLTFE